MPPLPERDLRLPRMFVRTPSRSTSRIRRRALAAAVSCALAFPARVAEAHGDDECGTACDFGQVLLVAVPTALGSAALAADVATVAHLARTGTVPRVWSLMGVVLWVPPTLVAAAGVVGYSIAASSSREATRADATLPLTLSVAGLAIGAGSLTLQIFAATRPPSSGSAPGGQHARGLRDDPARPGRAPLTPWISSHAEAWMVGVAGAF